MKNITYKTPQRNGEILLDPRISQITTLVQDNRHTIRNYPFKINNIPFQTLRDETRFEVLKMALDYTYNRHSVAKEVASNAAYKYTQNVLLGNIRQESEHREKKGLNTESAKNIPVVMTGHEPVPYHPGIWIKNHLAHYLAQKTGGIGVNLIVDNDSSHIGFFYMPAKSKESYFVRKVNFLKEKNNVAYEEIVIKDINTLFRFKEECADYISNMSTEFINKKLKKEMLSMFERFVHHVSDSYHRGYYDIVTLLSSARKGLEEEFGVYNLEIPVSWVCKTKGFYHFLLHFLYNAEKFAEIYNSKLAEYRNFHKIRSRANPLSDLVICNDLVELPFWTWVKEGSRKRCYLLKDSEFITITNGKDCILRLKKDEELKKNIAFLTQTFGTAQHSKDQHKIRPRAITTTMFSRLFLSDVFIHGIGGAKYDAITDEIIKDFFGILPPDYITVSTALFLPFKQHYHMYDNLQNLQRELKDMQTNPERYAPKTVKNNPQFIEWANEKRWLIENMKTSDKKEKRQMFNRIKELNSLLFNLIHDEFQNKQKEVTGVKKMLAYDNVAKFREYPIWIFPVNNLKDYFLNAFCGEKNINKRL